ncbi:MAG: glycosyltransferase [Chlorobi bacterium]|nr:glycosyltransferase [Chlorobiota bacterium]
MKILQLAPRFPYPCDDGGKIGIANITRAFAEAGHEVTLFSFIDNKPSEGAVAKAQQFSKPIFFKHSTANTVPRILKYFLLNQSLYIKKHSNAAIESFFKEFLAENDFDIIHADHTCMAPLGLFIKDIIKKPLGLRLHNIEWMIWQRYADSLSKVSPKRIYIQHQANALRKAEAKFCSKADCCLAITEPDKAEALKLAPDANVIVAGAGVNPDEWSPYDTVERNPYELVLATTYNWVHNIDAVRWFVQEVLPIVKKSVPKVKLTLIGKNTPAWLDDYKEYGVDPIGYVDKVQPYMNRATVNIAPLFVGGGIRIKILEAMAMKLPVVASPVAAEGINATQNEGLYQCESAESFAETIVELLKNPELRRQSGEAARDYILNKYTWKQNVGKILDAYTDLLG